MRGTPVIGRGVLMCGQAIDSKMANSEHNRVNSADPPNEQNAVGGWEQRLKSLRGN